VTGDDDLDLGGLVEGVTDSDDAQTVHDFVAGYLVGSARFLGDVEIHAVLGRLCPSFTLNVEGVRLVVHVDKAIA
jgi:hypothetical protein